MDVRVLGQIEIRGDGSGASTTSADGTGTAAIGGPRQRRLLAALVVRSGEVVSMDQLIDIVWAGDRVSLEVVEQLSLPAGSLGNEGASGVRFHPSGDRLLCRHIGCEPTGLP